MPDKKKSLPKPTGVDAPAELEKMVEQIAAVAADERMLNHEQARHLLEELRQRVQGVVQMVRLHAEEDEARKQAIVEIDKLIDSIARVQNELGHQVANASDQIKAAVRGDTLPKTAEALHLFTDWLSNPTPEGRAKIEALVANLRAITGADPFLDDEKAEKRRQAELEANVKKSLDEIFGDMKIKPPL
jgi:hypothetical protein